MEMDEGEMDSDIEFKSDSEDETFDRHSLRIYCEYLELKKHFEAVSKSLKS